MLSLCATPIGNMGDITARVVNALTDCDAVFCEDTRRTGQLLHLLGISKPLVSCHRHNEQARAEELMALLNEGKHICYASDAGMPGISDPGARLIAACIERDLPFEVLPGASAVLTAAASSGLPCGRFTFFGFLPRAGRERREALEEIENCKHLVILYESPQRVAATLKDLFDALGDCDAALLRELTKKFEEAVRGRLSALKERFAEPPRGECVILVDCGSRKQTAPAAEELDAVIRAALNAGLSVRDAAAEAATACSVSKKNAYARALKLGKE